MRLKKWITPIIIISLSLAISWYFYATKPIAKKAPPRLSSPVVLTVPSQIITTPLHLKALGTVKASQETTIRSRVSGMVTQIADNFQPGSLVAKDEILLQIDPADYINEVKLKESTLAKAKADYEIELGQQKVAKAEFAQLNKTLNPAGTSSTLPGSKSKPNQSSALALRAPHLAQAKSALDTAQTNVDQAKLALSRTTLTAPFNALVTERKISLGSQASPADALATLVNTDAYWVEAALPLDKIASLGVASYADIPAQITSSTGQEFQGKVLRSLGSLDSTTRMGRILIEVPNPQTEKNSPHQLLLGDQVQVDLKVGQLENVIVLPRAALRGGDVIWIYNAGQLEIRPVQVLWRDLDKFYLGQGMTPDELVITSDLATPMHGMNLRLPRIVDKPETPTISATPTIIETGATTPTTDISAPKAETPPPNPETPAPKAETPPPPRIAN